MTTTPRDHDDHGHHHDHDHPGHGHAHAPARFDRAFAVGIALNMLIVVLQAVYGTLANSLALIADAAHNFSDVIALVLAYGASVLGRRPPSERFTYGLRKTSVLAALANAALLLVATGAILWEAAQRLFHPEPVASNTVIAVATLGIVINTATALMFMRGRDSDLNVRGAFLHMAGDAAVSAGVVLAALVIKATGWWWVDPAMSLVVAGVIIWTSWGLARDSLHLALDAVPRGIDRGAVEAWLRGLPGVTDVHDLHIWAMGTTETAMTVHLVRPGAVDDGFVREAAAVASGRFQIAHATFQIESGDPAHPCALAPADVV